MKNKFLGFTYVEALMTLFIIAIIAAVSAPLITKAAKKPPSMGGAGGAPLGTIVMFPSEANILPTGWVECDGRDISKNQDYMRLRTAIRADNIPDLRGTYLIQIPEEMEQMLGLNQPNGVQNNNNGTSGSVIKDSYGRVIQNTSKYGGSGNYGFRNGGQSQNQDSQGGADVGGQLSAIFGKMTAMMQAQKPVKVRWIIRAH